MCALLISVLFGAIAVHFGLSCIVLFVLHFIGSVYTASVESLKFYLDFVIESLIIESFSTKIMFIENFVWEVRENID